MLTDLAAIEGLLDFQPSYFELLTAAAFRWFSDEAVSAAVVEVGLLGRWDATNVVDGLVAVLTNVGHDHTDGQGDWRRRIAEEKAGHRQGGRHLRARRDRSGAGRCVRRHAGGGGVAARRRLRVRVERARRRRSPARPPHARAPATRRCSSRSTARTRARTPPSRVAAAEAFFGRPLDPDIVFDAFAAVRNPGRFEVVQHDPLLILDGAHNREGAIAAAEALAEGFTVTGVTHLVDRCARRSRPRRAPRDPRRRGRGHGRVLRTRLAACAAGVGARRARRARRRPAASWSTTSARRSSTRWRSPRPTTSCSSPVRSTPSASRVRRAARARVGEGPVAAL